MKIIQLFGPPGTGKTTSLSQSVQKAVSLRQDRSCLLIASLTNAAAKEIAGRNLPVNPSLVGTLHALCYRQMNHPPLVTKAKYIEEWNGIHPELSLSVDKREKTPEDDTDSQEQPTEEREFTGDSLREELGLYIHKMTPRSLWKPEVVHFSDLWTAYKDETGTCDFEDMILAGLSFSEPPMAAPLGIYDEAQDFSKLEFTVIRHWSQSQDYVMISGDDDQALFSFRGADPQSFINCGTEEPRILNQSYRLPFVIQQYCEAWAKQILMRKEKPYLPRKDENGRVVEGFLGNTEATYKHPEDIMRIIEQAEKKNQTTMILAACSYQLNATISLLRKEGVPFGNRWRPTNGAWNPLMQRGRYTAAQRLAAFLSPTSNARYSWTHSELQAWAPLMDATKVFMRGAKKRIQEMSVDDMEIESGLLRELFTPESLTHALLGNAQWFFRNCTTTDQNNSALQYALAIHDRVGIENATPPKVTVGTVHSTKGSESDNVILFPDLSPSGYDQWEAGGEAQDNVLRQFYVGLSRARESLYLAERASNFAVDWL